jgi:hypothetical protein
MSYSAKSERLADLCEVQTGYTVRSGLRETKAGGVPAIQLRDLRGENELDPTGLPLYGLGPSFDRYWARPGDVLFRSRGDRNTAVLITGTAKAGAIAVLPLIILRSDRQRVEPAYLTWFINQPETQRYFDKCAQLGTTMRLIPKNCLDELEVAVPDLATQRLIVEIDALARRERDLTHQLADKRQKLTEFALLQQARNAQPHGNGTGRLVAPRLTPKGKSERTNQ